MQDLEVLLKQLQTQNGGSEAKLGKWGSRQFSIPLNVRANVSHLTIGPTENLMIAEWNGYYGVGKTTTEAVSALKIKVQNVVKNKVRNVE